jgi:hypothetical protein
MKILTELADVVKVLGGPKRLAALTSATREAVWNWINLFEAFPPNTFVIMTDELKKLGYGAHPPLWKMREKVSKSRPAQKPSLTQKSRKVASKRRDGARTRLKTSLAASP